MILEGAESQAWEKASLYMEDIALALDFPAKQFCFARQSTGSFILDCQRNLMHALTTKCTLIHYLKEGTAFRRKPQKPEVCRMHTLG